MVERLNECGLSVFQRFGAGVDMEWEDEVGAKWNGEVVISLLWR